MKLYHGSDNPTLTFLNVKPGHRYHPGAGPVEFLGPSFSDHRDVASSYGEYVYQIDFFPRSLVRFKSLTALRNHVLKTFAFPVSGANLGHYYRDIADSYRAKLIAEGHDAIIFPENSKMAVRNGAANTIILLSVSAVTFR